MTDSIALVTGGNRGLGLETVTQLARSGVHVVIAARDRRQGVEAALKLQAQGLSVEALQLDVADAESIAAAAREFARKHSKLDILVNNAGITGETGAPSAVPVANWRMVFETNLFGVIETTQAFLPLLRKSAAGRIVNLSSVLGSITLHAGESLDSFKHLAAYNASKSALNAWTVHLAHELRETPIKVNAVHPGYVKTEMNKGGGEMEIPDGARSSVQMALIGADGPSGSFTHLGEALPW